MYEGTRDQPMPGPFPAPPIFQGKSPGDEVVIKPLILRLKRKASTCLGPESALGGGGGRKKT